MNAIETEEEFKRIIRSDQAIIFIWFPWSSQARLSETVVNEWEQEWSSNYPTLKIAVYKVAPDDYPFTHDWMRDEIKVKVDRGYGSLVWIKDGVVAHYEFYAAKIGTEEITRLTKLIYG